MPKGSKPVAPTGSPQEKAEPVKQGNREVVYPERYAEFADGENALIEERCKEIMGWIEDPDEAAKEGLSEPLFKYKYYDGTSSEGTIKKVWCKNNVENRPLYLGNAMNLVQELLNKRWAGPNGSGKPTFENPDGETLNPEPIIISKTGQVLNGQHQGVAVILAQNELRGPNRYHWEQEGLWPDGIVKMDKLIVFGISEVDSVINTMDTCRPRSLSDVIYRSPFFKDKPNKDRVAASKMLDSAIRVQWERLGIKLDAWAPRRTHAEAVDFINRHMTLLHCVNFILEHAKGQELSKYIPQGHAAGLMFLMAGSATADPDEYHTSEYPTEEKIDFSNMDMAEGFWKAFISGSEMAVAREEIGWLTDEDTMKGARLEEKEAIVIKAWNCWKEGENVTKNRLKLKYETNDDTGISRLKYDPSLVCGGIDLGKPKEKVQPEDADDVIDDEVANGGEDDAGGDADEPDEAPPPPPPAKKPQAQAPKGKDPAAKLKTEPVFSPEERANLLGHIKGRKGKK